MNEKLKKLKELQQAFAAAQKKFQESKAYGPDCSEQDTNEALCSMFQNLSDRISYIAESFWDYTYEHSKGHIPPINSVSGMEKALKVLGLADDYDVYKPMISVAREARGIVAYASYRVK